MKYSETISEVTHCPIPRTELLKVTKLENGQDGGGGDSDNQGGSDAEATAGSLHVRQSHTPHMSTRG